MTDKLLSGINCFTGILHVLSLKPNCYDFVSGLNIHAFLGLFSQEPYFSRNLFFQRVLGVDVKEIFRQYKEIFTFLNSIGDLNIENTCFLKHRSVLMDSFKNILREDFDSKITFLDFTEIEGATNIINSWMSENTSRKIENICGLDDHNINLTYLNALHFGNNWTEPFSVDETVTATFYLNQTDSIQVQMMKRKGKFYYKDDMYFGAQVLKLPFADSKASLVIVLPKEHQQLDVLERQLSARDLALLTKDMKEKELQVSLPKFKGIDNLKLADYLEKMGLKDVFNACLINIVDGEALRFGEIYQKAFLDVNEKGSEAASGTVSILTNAGFEKVIPDTGLIIYEASISTDISNRFAKTKVLWRVKNSNPVAANADFKVVLNENAFITEFFMEIQGNTYKSYVKEKEVAKNIYNTAVARGQNAGLVEATTRDSREFTVSVNLESDCVALFSLTYEELLQRVHDQYELVLNICPGQIVEDLSIEVHINESRPLKFVKTPPLRSGNNISKTEYDKYLNPMTDIRIINSKTASVKFRPDPATQARMGCYLIGEKEGQGLSGQFVVQYDVEREPLDGEVLLQDGYFVHFFAPNDLDPLSKHIVFVLDTSTSMRGRKIEQLKDAMMNILNELRENDMLSIIEFNSDVAVWDINSNKFSVISCTSMKNLTDPCAALDRHLLADPQLVSEDIIQKAKRVVENIQPYGQTFMIGGLVTALHLVKRGDEMNREKGEKMQPIIIFLTDGQPNIGIASTGVIEDTVTKLNVPDKVPIFSLSFGNGADRGFLRRLSLKNLGFSRHIYEAADASLQLQDFYKQISSPLLHNVKFQYDSEVQELTTTVFPIYFRGSELIVAGRYGSQSFPNIIHCWCPHGALRVRSTTERAVTSLERLWAYLTVKQLLDERNNIADHASLTRKATDLALKYSFVTEVTSLVVVKPNENTTLLDSTSAPRPSFGSSQAPPTSFSSGQAPPSPFGSSQAPPPPPPSFGSGLARTSLFGSGQAPPSLFGNSQAPPSLFGSSHVPPTLFGSSQAPSSSFGSGQAPTTSFGSSQAPTFSFGSGQAPATLFDISQGPTFSFGSRQAPATLFDSSQGPTFSFGSGQAPSTLFGSQAPSSFGHGQAPATLFGSSQAPSSSVGSGQAPSTLFGSQAPIALFGNSQAPTASFGNSQGGFVGQSGFTPFSSSMSVDGDGSKSAEEVVKEFTANRPFLVMLQVEKDDTTLILFIGRVNRPSY